MSTINLQLSQQLTRQEGGTYWFWLSSRSVMLITLYYAVGLWGFVFTPDTHGIPLVWPATGVGLAFVYLYGYHLLPALGVAAALVSWQFTATIVPILEAIGIIFATMAGAALGAYALHRFEFSARLERLHDVWLLLVIGALAGSGSAATAGAWGLAVGMKELQFTETWWRCWLADLMGLVFVAPALITWLGARFIRPLEHTYLKGAVLISSLIGITTAVYSGQLPYGVSMPLSYAVFPLVMLAALRCPVQVTSTLMLTAGGIALSGTGWGLGPFAEMGLETSLLSLNAQLALLVLTGLTLTALRGEREAAESRARQHLDQPARAGRLSTLGELSAGLAHELNQPLCALASYAQASKRLLERGKLEELREALIQLDAGAHRAAATVRQMRAFASDQLPERHSVSPEEWVRPVMELLHPELRRKNIELQMTLDDPLPPILAAPLQVEQVLVNLLRNAIEALEGRRAGRIHLSIGRAGDELCVSVTDNGPGIPPEHLTRLFDPFATWKEGGLGLGLSISRSLVEAHGGRLMARNAASGGAVLQFTLPVEVGHVGA
ncbi:MAG: ATP-binding protein [Gammaproteobacteria bacterium]